MTEPYIVGQPYESDITGCLLPWYPDREQPLLLLAPGSETILLPLFTTEEQFHQAMMWISPRGTVSIKQVDDGDEFLRSLRENKQKLLVALNPWRTPEGLLRFTGVFLPEDFPGNAN